MGLLFNPFHNYALWTSTYLDFFTLLLSSFLLSLRQKAFNVRTGGKVFIIIIICPLR